MQSTALHCMALHCPSLHSNTLDCIAIHCSALHCTALHWTALHCTTTHCTALKWTTFYCVPPCTKLHSEISLWSPALRVKRRKPEPLIFDSILLAPVGVQCCTVQCSAVQCSAVQCSAVLYSEVMCSAEQCSCEVFGPCTGDLNPRRNRTVIILFMRSSNLSSYFCCYSVSLDLMKGVSNKMEYINNKT